MAKSFANCKELLVLLGFVERISKKSISTQPIPAPFSWLGIQAAPGKFYSL